ncbi:hypothetical protein [Mesorhizobium sp. KR9-304]|uniref:hypothetical protein n=1 Tax=Mesorhizobium sp. KR9-304 TaxID=3156614 RepID=UPI0032B3C26B
MTVFVHSWFRSGSTWLWAKFRDDSRFVAYYEPLNEELPLWTPQRLDTAAARAFDGDNHPTVGKHYFYEYRDLIASDRLQFDRSISYERYLLDADEKDIPLRNYLSGLISGAAASGHRPALCFCRSQMRSLWIKANFSGLHVAQIRNPWDQWVSFGKHPYFKNRTLLTAYCIEKRRPGSFSHVSGFNELVSNWNRGKQAAFRDIDCFTAYITIWIASSVQACIASDILLDIDLIGTNTAARRTIEHELRRSALPADLSDCRQTQNDVTRRIPSDYNRELTKALVALRGEQRRLLPSFEPGRLIDKLPHVSERTAEILRQVLT